MIGIQNIGGVVDVNLIVGAFLPRQADQRFQIGANHAIFGGGGRHLTQTIQFAAGLVLGLDAHSGFLDGLRQAIRLDILFVFFAQFAPNRLHLLAQHIIALGFAHFALHLRLNLLANFQHI